MPSRPAVPEMLTMLPRFCSIMTLRAALQQRKMALRVDVEDVVPFLFGDLVNLDHGAAEADAVDEDVEAAPAGDHVRHHSLHLRQVGGVGGDGDGLAALLLDGLNDAVELGLRSLQVHKGDFRALAGEGAGDAFADAAGTADDDCYLVCQFHGSSP